MLLASSLRDREVCVIGLGYVGLTLAVAMADVGFHVHGTEVRPDVLAQLRRGEPHFHEPRLQEKLRRVMASGRFSFSAEPSPDASPTVYILTVGTPLGKDGKASLGAVLRAAAQVAERLRDDDLVILRSTVKLGTARNVVAPILAGTGRRFALAVCPERTLEGRALLEIRELPQIIGADDADTRLRCQQLFSALTHTTVALSSLEAAELTKLVDNTYRDVMFGFANEVAAICSQAGLSALEVIRAGRLGYPRTNVALPGPVGGPCLEKDPHILVESARSIGLDLPITAAARRVNEQQPDVTVSLLQQACRAMMHFPKAPRITVAGLAFKGVPATDDLRGTMARPIVAALRAAFPGAQLSGYDPVVSADAIRNELGLDPCPSLAAAFADANVVVLANNHPELGRMDLGAQAARMTRPSVIYDYWNMHEDTEAAMPEGVTYLALGSERHQHAE